ncbi:MAG: esterase [Myxococcales bacterium]|nr:esterase [Myxococcales bacterium]
MASPVPSSQAVQLNPSACFDAHTTAGTPSTGPRRQSRAGRRAWWVALSLVMACAPAEPTGEDGLDGQNNPPMNPMDPMDPMKPPRPPLGMPLSVPADTWTWVDFPDSACDEGTTTGIGVNWNGSKNLLFFLMGGGACWDYLSCAVLNTSTHGPYGKAQFEAQRGGLADSILSRSPDNPFADYNMVFVPYCTGDVHAGDAVQTYEGLGKKKVVHHKGRPNLVAFLKRVAATLPEPEKVVLSGSSAGGFGAASSYDLVHSYFPENRVYLVDDSGPVFIETGIPKDLRDKWYASWNLKATFGPLCANCQSDLSDMINILATKYPTERMALLSYTEDKVIRGFFGAQQPQVFKNNLYDLADKRIAPRSRFKYYFVTGDSHTFLGSPGKTTAQGVRLLDWLKQQVTDDPTWTSTRP